MKKFFNTWMWLDNLLPATLHLGVGLFAPGQRAAVGDPEVLADEHVAAVLLPAHRVLPAAHLRDQQQGCGARETLVVSTWQLLHVGRGRSELTVQEGVLEDVGPDLGVLLGLLLAVAWKPAER